METLKEKTLELLNRAIAEDKRRRFLECKIFGESIQVKSIHFLPSFENKFQEVVCTIPFEKILNAVEKFMRVFPNWKILERDLVNVIRGEIESLVGDYCFELEERERKRKETGQ